MNFKRLLKASFTINVNFECILMPTDNKIENPNLSFTKKYQVHVPCSYRYKINALTKNIVRLLNLILRLFKNLFVILLKKVNIAMK